MKHYLSNINYKTKNKISQLFPTPLYKNKNLMIDEDSIAYITIPFDAEIISKIIREHSLKINNENNIFITDATAGVGGNTISFSNYFNYVNAIEIDQDRSFFLSNNINMYEIKNVSSYCDNALNLIYNFEYQNIVFIDPPWGGKNYKTQENLRLKLSDTEIEDVACNLLDKSITKSDVKMVVFKLPKNYDIKYLYKKLKNKSNIYLYELKKMIIIIIEKRIDN
jgi:tRNA/tmRNA/rRNA uracil-C5-methylase (TrmA/RlmC/RlmD family)